MSFTIIRLKAAWEARRIVSGESTIRCIICWIKKISPIRITLNANQSVVRRMIMDSIHFWVTEMHVDGFRFDLASILSRSESGEPLQNPPILWDIESDPVLAGVKLIAEA